MIFQRTLKVFAVFIATTCSAYLSLQQPIPISLPPSTRINDVSDFNNIINCKKAIVRLNCIPASSHSTLDSSSDTGSTNRKDTAASVATNIEDDSITRSKQINLPLENIKNMRDISTSSDWDNEDESIHIKPGRVYRTGCVSKASPADMKCLVQDIKFKTLIDLRSQKELDEDELLYSSVYDDYHTYSFNTRTKKFSPEAAYQKDVQHKKRFFVSLMSESLIKKGVFFRLRKRIRAKAIGLAVLSIFSRRMKSKMRNIFIRQINGGGLTLLNELVVDQSGPEIIHVLKLVADPNNHPLAMYCTAGKDRTGLITMFILKVIGLSDKEVVEDYVLSDSAYKDINDKKAMVASLSQVDVDPETFLRAKPEVMYATMNYIRQCYGSIDGYLDEYGFDHSWRERLREVLLN